MEMPFKEAWKLILKNIEEKRRDKLWEIWLAKYQHMDGDNFMSFEDFYELATQGSLRQNHSGGSGDKEEDYENSNSRPRKSTAEIISMAEAIAARDSLRKTKG